MNPHSRRPHNDPTRRLANVPLPPALRLAPPRRDEASPHRRDDLLAKIEAILWLADAPISLKRVATLAELPDQQAARQAIDRLRGLYDADGSAFQIEEIAGGFQLLTRPAFYPWLIRIRRGEPDNKLSPALQETLAVVAHRQPVTRAEVEAIRGVRCDDALNALMERQLVEIVGRHDSLGRPALYGTTKKFLHVYGLRDLTELV